MNFESDHDTDAFQGRFQLCAAVVSPSIVDTSIHVSQGKPKTQNQSARTQVSPRKNMSAPIAATVDRCNFLSFDDNRRYIVAAMRTFPNLPGLVLQVFRDCDCSKARGRLRFSNRNGKRAWFRWRYHDFQFTSGRIMVCPRKTL